MSGAEEMFELMRKEANRLKTFQMNPPWPKDYVDIKKLAKAGFFYAFSGDKVFCAFCRGQVNHWDRDDDPMSEHARHFTTCPFIMGGEVGNEPLGEDPFPGPKRPRPYDVCGAYPNFPPDDPRYQEELREREHDARSYEQDEPEQHPGQHPQNQDAPQILQPIHEPGSQNQIVDQRSSINNDQNQVISSPPPISSREQQGRLINGYNLSEVHRMAYNEGSVIRSFQGNMSEVSVAAPNNLTGICKICYTNSIELVFLPCGHSVSCLSCAQRLFSCPFCRETITTRIRTYLV